MRKKKSDERLFVKKSNKNRFLMIIVIVCMAVFVLSFMIYHMQGVGFRKHINDVTYDNKDVNLSKKVKDLVDDIEIYRNQDIQRRRKRIASFGESFQKSDMSGFDYVTSEAGRTWVNNGLSFVIWDNVENKVLYSNLNFSTNNFKTLQNEVENNCENFTVYTKGNETIVCGSLKTDIDNATKEYAYARIHSMDYSDGTSIWIKEIQKMEGGNAYAVRYADSLNPDYEGIILSTETEDAKGNKPNRIELDGVIRKGGVFYNYFDLEENDSDISEKRAYAYLYRRYNWIIGCGIFTNEIDKIVERTIATATTKELFGTVIIFALFVFLIFILNKYSKEETAFVKSKIYYDNLTGLPNRQYVYELQQDYDFATVGIINIDGFKFINETYGHDGGDAVLIEMANRLKKYPRFHSARIGADEFAIILSTDITNHPAFTDELRKDLDKPIIFNNQKIDVSHSTGYAIRNNNENIKELLMRADLSLFEAKSAAMHGVSIHSEGLKNRLDTKRQITDDIETAIEEESFQVLYQPIVNAETVTVMGFEALCRYKDDKYYPGQFIPIAEQNGMIIQIDRIITKKVIEQIAKWRDEGYDVPGVAINYSAVQLKDEGYPAFLNNLLKKYDISPQKIRIEITESNELGDNARSRNFFNSMKKVGVNLALDDFGTGYSTIGALNMYPVSTIKFDKSINDQYLQEGKETYLKHLIELTHDLGKKIVAEGIETGRQFNLARELKMDAIQGYYFSRPLSADEAMKWSPDIK